MLRSNWAGASSGERELGSEPRAQIGSGVPRQRLERVTGDGREQGKPGRVGCQVRKRDRTPVALRRAKSYGKVPIDGIVELEFLAMHHVGQKERSEDLGQRTDFEQRVSGNGSCIARVLFAVDDHPSASTLDDPDGHACRAFLDVNATTENIAYRRVRKVDGLGLGSVEGQETGAGTQDKHSSIHLVQPRSVYCQQQPLSPSAVLLVLLLNAELHPGSEWS